MTKESVKEIVLFASSGDPVHFKIDLESSLGVFSSEGGFERIIQLPQPPVVVYDSLNPRNPEEILIKQNPPVAVIPKPQNPSKQIKDDGLFGIRCWINRDNRETNPPELLKLLYLAQELNYQITLSPLAVGLLGLAISNN